jgi:hypothetical protein
VPVGRPSQCVSSTAADCATHRPPAGASPAGPLTLEGTAVTEDAPRGRAPLRLLTGAPLAESGRNADADPRFPKPGSLPMTVGTTAIPRPPSKGRRAGECADDPPRRRASAGLGQCHKRRDPPGGISRGQRDEHLPGTASTPGSDSRVVPQSFPPYSQTFVYTVRETAHRGRVVDTPDEDSHGELPCRDQLLRRQVRKPRKAYAQISRWETTKVLQPVGGGALPAEAQSRTPLNCCVHNRPRSTGWTGSRCPEPRATATPGARPSAHRCAQRNTKAAARKPYGRERRVHAQFTTYGVQSKCGWRSVPAVKNLCSTC